MKKVLIVFSFCILLVFTVKSQYLELEDKPSFSERIFYGGNIGLSFGYYTFISVNPIIGYRITNRLSAGIGGNYIYMSSKADNNPYSISLWGGNAFASYTIIKELEEIIPFISSKSSLLLYGEYNIMNVESYYSDLGRDEKWQVNPLLGFALQSGFGGRSYVIIKVLYNFNEYLHSLYPNPVIRVSFQI